VVENQRVQPAQQLLKQRCLAEIGLGEPVAQHTDRLVVGG
jgi:hypothetical protein